MSRCLPAVHGVKLQLHQPGPSNSGSPSTSQMEDSAGSERSLRKSMIGSRHTGPPGTSSMPYLSLRCFLPFLPQENVLCSAFQIFGVPLAPTLKSGAGGKLPISDILDLSTPADPFGVLNFQAGPKIENRAS